MGTLLTIIGLLKSVYDYFIGARDQKLGKLEQQHADDVNTLQTATNAAKFKQEVENMSIGQLDANLDRRVRQSHDD